MVDLVPIDFQVDVSKIPKGKSSKTLNGHSREKLTETLKRYLVDTSIDSSNLLSAELIASGGYLYFWDIILEVTSENLMSIMSPKLAKWLLEEHKLLNSLRNKFHNQLCNNQEARNHISQIISILCLSQKNKLSMPKNPVQVSLDPKSKAISEEYLLLSQLEGSELEKSKLNDALTYFIYHINHNETKNSLYWIHQIVQMEIKNIKINPINTFKTPKSLAQHPSWILWNFIFIRVPPNLKSFLDDLISLFIWAMSRKKWESASFFVFSGLLVLKYQKQIKWDNRLPKQHPTCIKTIGRINFIYQELSQNNILKDKNPLNDI